MLELTEEDRERLESLKKVFEKGTVLFREGEKSRHMYILLEGKVNIYKGKEKVATIDKIGSYIGEMSTLLGVPRSASAVVMKKSSLIVVPPESVNVFFENAPEIGLKLAKVMAERLYNMNNLYSQLASKYEYTLYHFLKFVDSVLKDILRVQQKKLSPEAVVEDLKSSIQQIKDKIEPLYEEYNKKYKR